MCFTDEMTDDDGMAVGYTCALLFFHKISGSFLSEVYLENNMIYATEGTCSSLSAPLQQDYPPFCRPATYLMYQH